MWHINSTNSMSILYNPSTGGYRMATVKEIRAIYFADMAQCTFVDLFSTNDLAKMREAGFKSFRGYQNPQVVKYILENVGRIYPKSQ